jgi:hypothetical protein
MRGTSCADSGSPAHFVSGEVRSGAATLASMGSAPIVARTCWPAVTTSGVCELAALVSAPMALPVPEAECRFTSAGRPVACA